MGKVRKMQIPMLFLKLGGYKIPKMHRRVVVERYFQHGGLCGRGPRRLDGEVVGGVFSTYVPTFSHVLV